MPHQRELRRAQPRYPVDRDWGLICDQDVILGRGATIFRLLELSCHQRPRAFRSHQCCLLIFQIESH
jgi:hypothetical protein